MNKQMLANMGKMGRDKVTGFEGMITAVAKHLYGCDTYYLTPKVNEKGERRSDEAGWFDEGRIQIIPDKPAVKPADVKSSKPGGEQLKHIE
jgi:hypothetical protein